MNTTANYVYSLPLAFVLVPLASAEDFQGPDYRLEKGIPYREGSGITEYMRERCRLDVFTRVALSTRGAQNATS